MANKAVQDTFANLAFLTVTETAANTLTFAQLQIASNLMDKKYALVINRAEYLTSVAATVFDTTGDYINIALVVSNKLTTIADLSQPEVLDMVQFMRTDYGTAATSITQQFPIVKDFTNLPGGGILVPADRLYLAAKGTGLASASVSYVRMYYTVKEITVNDYWELIEARRIMTT
jgi:hypothetical protein